MAKRASKPKVFRHRILLTEHVFDKLRSIDLSLSEFEILLERGVVIEEAVLRAGLLKELVLLTE